MKQIHGHEVLKLMLGSGKTYTRKSLASDIIQKFGSEARFCTCSARNMTAEQLVEFLDAKGKFVPQAEGFQTAANLMCKDGDDHHHHHEDHHHHPSEILMKGLTPKADKS